jgi:hypothetical protein
VIKNVQRTQNKRGKDASGNGIKLVTKVPILAWLCDRSEISVPKVPDALAISEE